MKKFTKVVLVIALILSLLGIGIIVVSAAMGGVVHGIPFIYAHNDRWWNDHREEVWDEVWNEAEDDWDEAWNKAGEDWDEAWSEAGEDWDEAWSEAGEDWDKAWSEAGEDWKELSKELKKELDEEFVLEHEQTFAGVRSLDIEANAGVVQLIKGEPGSEFVVRYSPGAGEIQMLLEERDTLKVRYHWKKKTIKKEERRHLQIVVPEGYEFDKVEVEMNAGLLHAEELTSGELDLDINAGLILVENGKVRELEADCKAGELAYSGTADRSVSADCKAGSIDICLDAAETDYSYEIKPQAGSILVGGSSYAGLGQTKILTNPGAQGEMELESSAGAISVIFNQE